MEKETTATRDVYEIITNRIITQFTKSFLGLATFTLLQQALIALFINSSEK